MRTDPVDRSSAGLSRLLGVGAGAAALAVSAAYATVGGLVALAALLLVVAGLVSSSHRFVTVGAAALLGAVLYAGLEGAPAGALLVGVAACVFAWDAGGFAIDLGAQLGREADTRRVELLHALGSAAVAVATAGTGYAVYLVAAGGQPVAALLLLLLAGVLLAAALDHS